MLEQTLAATPVNEVEAPAPTDAAEGFCDCSDACVADADWLPPERPSSLNIDDNPDWRPYSPKKPAPPTHGSFEDTRAHTVLTVRDCRRIASDAPPRTGTWLLVRPTLRVPPA